jgi:hypothetical protein
MVIAFRCEVFFQFCKLKRGKKQTLPHGEKRRDGWGRRRGEERDRKRQSMTETERDFWAGVGGGSMLQSLPSVCETLGSIHSTEQKEKSKP